MIAQHGGGGCASAVNDQQYEHMKVYYSKIEIHGCIYISLHGLRDVWNQHCQPEHERFLRLLIVALHIKYRADMNSVMMTGFSAGGDGCHMLGSMFADVYAFVNASAGHPNGVSFLNRCRQSFWIQCGENDKAYDRNVTNLRYGMNVEQLNLCYPYLFENG